VITPRASLVLLALAAACGGGASVAGNAPAAPPPRTLAPTTFIPGGPWRYRYDRLDSITTLLPNGGRQLQVVERHFQLRWQGVASATGIAVRLTLDSVDLVGIPNGLGRGMEDSARGSVIQFTLTPDGLISAPTPVPESSVGRALIHELNWIIPALPHSLAQGAVRQDTLTDTVPFGTMAVTEHTVRQTSVGATIGTFDVVGEITRDGTSPQLQLTGAGHRGGEVAFAPQGWMRLAAGRDSVLMTATVEAMGQSVALTQIGAYSFTALP
jgi:hypothetical protein